MVKLMSLKTIVLTCIEVVIFANIINSEQNTNDMESLAAIVDNKLLNADPSLNKTQIKSSEIKNKNMRKSATTKLPPLFYSPFIPAIEKESEETIILQNPIQETKSQISVRSNTNGINTDGSFTTYKQLRQKIGRLLKEEVISKKTKTLLFDTFDKMINQMSLQCTQNDRSKTKPKNLRLGKSDRKARKEMLKSWKSQFNKLINKYCEKQDSSDFSSSKENIQFLSTLREFFFEMHSEFENLTSQYDLNCRIINADNILRSPKKFSVVENAYNLPKEENKKRSSEDCKFYIICDYELQKFFDGFYMGLQKTVYKIFHNYEAMYLVDFATEPETDKTMFVSFIKDVSEKVNRKFNETFSKETTGLDLDSTTDITEKVDIVKRAIDETITRIKLLIDDVLTEKGTALPNKMRFAVKSDIMTNTDIELSLIQEEFELKMCESFEKCHGRETRRLKRKRE